MLNIPDWAHNFMKKRECPHCSNSMRDATIVQVGIKIQEKKPCLFYESKCKFCNKVSHTTIYTDANLSAYQLAAEILNSFDEDSLVVEHSKVGSAKKKKSKMAGFEKDFLKLKSFMKNNDNYLEFLKYVGLTDAEIEMYARWDNNENEDQNISK